MIRVRHRWASAIVVGGLTAASCATSPRPLASTAAPANATSASSVEPRAAVVEAKAAPSDYDINHVIATGQSLAIGVGGRPFLTNEQPFSNLMFAGGVIAGREELDSLVPLVEGDFIPGSKAQTETMSSAFANLACDEGRHPIL